MEAVPVLLRILQAELGDYGFTIARPIRRPRSEFVSEERTRRSVRLALGTPDCSGILILFDADDACPREFGPKLEAWARAEAGVIPCEVVLANREYEAWFLAAIESLRSFRGMRVNAASHPDPESVRDCKGALDDRMETGSSYSPTVDQAAFTSRFDLRQAYVACRSFRRMVNAFGNLASAVGATVTTWPPEAWQ